MLYRGPNGESEDYAASANAEREFAFIVLAVLRDSAISACFTRFKITVETSHPLVLYLVVNLGYHTENNSSSTFMVPSGFLTETHRAPALLTG